MRTLRRHVGRIRGFLTVSSRLSITEVTVIAAIVGLDQAVKAVVRDRFDLYESVTVVPGLFDLTRVHNSGTAFGFLSSIDVPFKPLVLSAVAGLALFGLGWYLAALPRSQPLSRLGLSLVLGGAVGNLIDRVTLGYVIDFVDIFWRGWHFWAFNVADAAISVGVCLMLLNTLGLERRTDSSGT